MWTQAISIEEAKIADVSPFRVSKSLVCDDASFATGEVSEDAEKEPDEFDVVLESVSMVHSVKFDP